MSIRVKSLRSDMLFIVLSTSAYGTIEQRNRFFQKSGIW